MNTFVKRNPTNNETIERAKKLDPAQNRKFPVDVMSLAFIGNPRRAMLK